MITAAYLERRRKGDLRDRIRAALEGRPRTCSEIKHLLGRGTSWWSVAGNLLELERAGLVSRRQRVTRGPRGGRHVETEWLIG